MTFHTIYQIELLKGLLYRKGLRSIYYSVLNLGDPRRADNRAVWPEGEVQGGGRATQGHTGSLYLCIVLYLSTLCTVWPEGEVQRGGRATQGHTGSLYLYIVLYLSTLCTVWPEEEETNLDTD